MIAIFVVTNDVVVISKGRLQKLQAVVTDHERQDADNCGTSADHGCEQRKLITEGLPASTRPAEVLKNLRTRGGGPKLLPLRSHGLKVAKLGYDIAIVAGDVFGHKGECG